MLEVGITERGDPSLDFDWVQRLRPKANIIISKNLSDELMEALIAHKSVCIFHCTCTGWGNSKIEPNVPTYEETHDKVLHLIQLGFPAEQIVLRVDPILPVRSSFRVIGNVLRMFSDTGITRVRYSYLDLYPHVKERFEQADIPLVVTSSFPGPASRAICEDIFESYSKHYVFESCAERDEHRIGCISQKDLDILGVDEPLEGNKGQRKACLCPANKFELLSIPRRCPYGCIYCYWHD